MTSYITTGAANATLPVQFASAGGQTVLAQWPGNVGFSANNATNTGYHIKFDEATDPMPTGGPLGIGKLIDLHRWMGLQAPVESGKDLRRGLDPWRLDPVPKR